MKLPVLVWYLLEPTNSGSARAVSPLISSSASVSCFETVLASGGLDRTVRRLFCGREWLSLFWSQGSLLLLSLLNEEFPRRGQNGRPIYCICSDLQFINVRIVVASKLRHDGLRFLIFYARG